MGLLSFFRRKFKKEEIDDTKMVDKVNFLDLRDAEDKTLTLYATKIMKDEPLIVNLEGLDIDSANKVIAFYSGVIYALDGEIRQIQDKVFLFANNGVYDDGSINELLRQIE